MKVAARLWPAALACVWWGCLDQPLGRADEAYDARADLRGDSLAGFDSVDVFLVDGEDGKVVARIWRGPLASAEELGAGLAGNGAGLAYLVKGYKRDRGACFQYEKEMDEPARVLMDTCAPGASGPLDPGPVTGATGNDPGGKPDPIDPGPIDIPEPPPRFGRSALDLTDSVPGRDRVSGAGLRPAVLRAEPAWLTAAWEASGRADTADPDRDSVLVARARIESLEAGPHAGWIFLESGGAAADTLPVRLTVSQRHVRGMAADWISGAPQAGIRVDLETGASALTGADGTYEIPVPAGAARFAARFSAPGRIGALDTLPLSSAAGDRTVTALPSEAAFRPVDLGSRPIGAIAACAGYGIVLSTPFNEAGYVHLVRLDGPRPVFETSIPLGNEEGDPGFPVYSEAGEMAADSQALYIAYPEARRIGRIGNWRGAAEGRIVSVPLQPGGLLLDGDRLLTLGRLDDGTLALARFRASDLALQEVDTLHGYAWDGALPLERAPRLAAGPAAYYAVDGNDPNAPGRLLRVDRETGAVAAAKRIPEGGLEDLIPIGDRIYVGSPNPDARRLLGFDADLSPIDTLDAGGPVRRLAGAAGAFAGFGFASAGKAVLAFVPQGKAPLGRLSVPTPGEARWMAVDGPARSVLVSDRSRLYVAVFRPE